MAKTLVSYFKKSVNDLSAHKAKCNILKTKYIVVI